MADGTVTGEFRLTTVQARRELERTQREGRETDRVMERAGKSMDTIGSPAQARQVRRYRSEIRSTNSAMRSGVRDVARYARETRGLASAADDATFGARRGGGGGAGVRGGMLGLSGGVRLMATQAAIALPVIRSLTGGIGALAQVAASAATGAGAVGAAGLVGMATGIGGIASVAVPAIRRIKEITDAQKEYNEAVREYGRRSKEAREARGELRTARRAGPAGAGALVLEAQAFGRAWTRATRQGQESLVGFLRETVRTGQRMRRPLAEIANQVTMAFTGQAEKGLRFLESRRVQRGLRAGGGIFSENLGNVRRIGQATVEMFLNVTRASRPFVKEFTDFMRGWFERQAGRTRNIRDLRRNIGDMVDDLKSVGRLGGAGGRLILALLGQTRAPGRSLLADATAQLDRWTAWVNRNPAKIQAFFRQSADDVRSLASSLASIVSLLNDIGAALRPILPGIQLLANAAGQIGGIATLGAGAAALGAVRGARGQPRGPGVVGTLFGMATGGLGGGRRGPAPRAPVAAPARGVTPGGVILPTGVARPATPARARPRPVGLRGGAARVGTLARGAPALARGALGGAARAYWPLALAMGGLGALGTEGGIGRRLQGGLSGLTGGLIGAPQSFEELRMQGADQASAFTRQLSPGPGLRGARGAQRAVRGERERLEGVLEGGRQVRTIQGTAGPVTRSLPITEDERKRLEGRIEALKADEEALKSHTASVRAAKAQRDVQRAPGIQQDIAGAFRVRRRGGQNIEQAGRKMVQGVLRQMRRLEPEGKKALAQANLTWLREQAKRNPAFRRLYDEMANRVQERFRRMGRRIEIINGRIFRNSREAWGNIRKSLTSETERARQEASADFTALQKAAVDSLTQMGWSRKEAAGIIKGQEAGGARAKGAGRAAAQDYKAYGTSGAGLAARSDVGALPPGRRRARGGRIRGRGLRDTVRQVDGGMAAPGELIVNRHTERDHDRDATMAGLPTLAQRVGREGRPHHAPIKRHRRGTDVYYRARGGRINLMGANPNLAPYAALGSQFGLTVTSGGRPGSITSSGNVSLHSSGNALDIGGSASGMLRYARVVGQRYGAGLDELIHTPLGWAIKNGQRVAPYAAADHYDHVHVGDRTPGGAGGMPAGGPGMASAGGFVEAVKLRTPRASQRGAPGGMVTAINRARTRGLEDRINQTIGAGSGAPGGGAVPGGGMDAWLTQALQITGRYSPANLAALRGRAMQESGGNPRAQNNWDSNAAAGIPSKGLLQTIDPTFNSYKLPGMGDIWNPVHNAVAAIRYMMGKYGHIVGPSSSGYATGGRVPFRGWFRQGGSFTAHGPQMIGVGDGIGSEQVSIGKRGGAGGGGINVNINMGSVHVASVDEAGSIGDQIGTQVASKIAAALREAPLTAAA